MAVAAGAFFLGLSAAGWGILGFGAYERNRFDPFYQPITCESLGNHMSGMKQEFPKEPGADVMIMSYLAGGNSSKDIEAAEVMPLLAASNVTADGWIWKKCSNPNQMTVTTETRQDGEIYLKEMVSNGTHDNMVLTAAGKAWVPQSTFPAGGAGETKSFSAFSLPLPTVLRLMGKSGPVTFVTKNFWRSGTSLTMLGQSTAMAKEYESWCGFQAFMANATLGPVGCASSLDELEVPDIFSTPGIDVINISDEARETGEGKRDMFCGLAMALGAVLGMSFSACGGCVIRRSRRAAKHSADKDKADGDSAREVSVAEVAADAVEVEIKIDG